MTSDFAFRPDLDPTALVHRGVTRDGLTQVRRYWKAAEPRAVVVLVHGIAEHSGRYEHVARQFVAAGVSVVAFDQRGHGESGGLRVHVDSFDQFHDDVEDQLAEVAKLGLPVFLLGHSMGGLVVAGYALTDRPQPDWVILSAPGLAVAAPRWLMRPVMALGAMANKVRIRLPLKLEDLSSDPRVGDAYADDALVETKATLGLIAAMVRAIRWTEPRVAGWAHDTLVIHGLADNIVPPEASEPVGQQPTVERWTYPDGRHELFNELNGSDVVDHVLAWMNERLPQTNPQRGSRSR